MRIMFRRCLFIALTLTIGTACGCSDNGYRKRPVKELMEAIKTPDSQERLKAMNELFQYKAGAREALPVLIELLKDKDIKVQQLAVGIIGLIGVEAVPELRKCLESPDPEIRAGAANTLCLVMNKPLDLIPVLVVAMKDKDGSVRYHAASAITQFARGATKQHFDFFLDVIKNDDNKRVRCILIQALGTWGKDAEKALPLFNELKANRDSEISTAAARAIIDIEGKEDLANPSGAESDFRSRQISRPPGGGQRP